MIFSNPLIAGTLIKREKRFLAHILLTTGEQIIAHCPNPGRMLDITTPGLQVWVTHNPDPARKLAYTWHFVKCEEEIIGMNTHLPNQLIAEALAARLIPALSAYETYKPEVRYAGDSRIDFLLSGPQQPECYVEVKNVHLKRGSSQQALALFPDSVTARGTKHLRHLTTLAQSGKRAVMVYVIQRHDCHQFSFAADIDPAYAAAAYTAHEAGVEMLAYLCRINLRSLSNGSIFLGDSIPVVFKER